MAQRGKDELSGGFALIALGSNVETHRGGPREIVALALGALDEGPMRLVAASRPYLTPFVPAGGGPDVVNAVAIVQSGLGADALLAELHRIEADFDRSRGTRWASRTLDLDLLALGDLVRPDEATVRHWIGLDAEEQRRIGPDRLILPHPRMQDRAFVLVPAAEVAADWRHPVLGLTIAEMVARLPAAEVAAVVPLA